MNKIRQVYDWVFSLANKIYGTIALFFILAFKSILFPILPDALLTPFILGNRKKKYFFAFICSLDSILGGCAGYLIGQVIWWNYSGEFSQFSPLSFQYVPCFDIESLNHIRSLCERYVSLIKITVGFTPIPVKVVTLSLGVFGISFSMFLIVSLVSRSSRFFLLTSIVKFYGDPIITFTDKYFNFFIDFIYHTTQSRIFIFKVIY